MSVSDIIAEMARERAEWFVLIGLITPDLRARYHFWCWMGNAAPEHPRWDYRPDVAMFIHTPADWT